MKRIVLFIQNTPVVDSFKKKHPRSRKPLESWFRIIKEGKFQCLMDLRETFNSVDYVEKEDVYIFNIGGNNYRLTAQIVFRFETLTVLKVETHDEYSKKRN